MESRCNLVWFFDGVLWRELVCMLSELITSEVATRGVRRANKGWINDLNFVSGFAKHHFLN